MAAVLRDALRPNWTKVTGKPVISFPKKGDPVAPHAIFDPATWKKDGESSALAAGSQRIPSGRSVRA
jgi:hypothetical protein